MDPAFGAPQVAGTGPGGRVTKGDVLAYLDSLSAAGPGTIAEDVAHGVPTTGVEGRGRDRQRRARPGRRCL